MTHVNAPEGTPLGQMKLKKLGIVIVAGGAGMGRLLFSTGNVAGEAVLTQRATKLEKPVVANTTASPPGQPIDAESAGGTAHQCEDQ